MRNKTYFTPVELKIFNRQKPIFNKAQMKIINSITPESEIEIKTDKSGFKYKSVKAAYVKAILMMVTGGNYCFEILNREYIVATREVIIQGRLTIYTNKKSIVREQIGQHYLNVKTDVQGNTTTIHASDIGNGYKSASSDCLKKCTSEFGFFWDIYGQEHSDQKKTEQPEPDHADKKKLERLSHFLSEAKTCDTIEHIYNKYLETGEETEASKTLLKKYMNLISTNK